MALAYHPAMREAEGLVRAARGDWLQVGLRPNPEIGYFGDEIGNDGRAGFQGGFVSQEFVTAGKLGLSRAVAIREVSAAEQRLERTRRQVVTTVRMYYYELLAAERSLALRPPTPASRLASLAGLRAAAQSARRHASVGAAEPGGVG